MRKKFVLQKTVSLCVLALSISLIAGCSAEKVSHKNFSDNSATVTDDTDWNTAYGEKLTLSNGNMEMAIDTTTTHFTVTDKTTGQSYSSVPSGDFSIYSDEIGQRIKSEVSLTYYDSDSKTLVMTSNGDSVEKEMFTVKYKDNTVRVYYNFGETAELLAPEVLPKEVFEKKICDKSILNSSQARRIKRYYTLYSSDDEPSEELKAMLELYPALKKQPLYILKDTVDTLNKMEISEICALVSFTEEDYSKIKTELDIGEIESDEAGFTVPIEYKLCDDGFSAEILTDKIIEKSSKFHLYSIDLLEYFAAQDKAAKGYFVVPDGSGALINLNDKSGNYTQSVYGTDLSLQSDSKVQLSKEVLLPVFGMSLGDRGVLAIIEQGEENAVIHANTISLSAPLNDFYASFIVRQLDTTDIGVDRNIPIYNLYAKHFQYSHPKVKYVLLSSGNCDYVGMAKYARNYYTERGLLNNNTAGSDWLVNYNCVITQEATFMGVPYTKKIVVSELEEIKKQYENSGIKGLSVRLSGYGNEGLAHKVYNDFSLYSKVGKKDQLKDIEKTVSGNSGKLYLEADFQKVGTDKMGDGYSIKADTAKYLNREMVENKAYDIVTRQYLKGKLSNYLVSPTEFAGISQSFIKSINKVFGSESNIGISYASAGSRLYGDYGSTKDYDRAMTAESVTEVLKKSAKNYSLMTENGYLYSLAYTDQIINAPLFSSNFDIASRELPFYQLIVHGSVSYTGTPINLSVAQDELILRSLEYGAGFYWNIIGKQDYLMDGTDYETFYYSMSQKKNFEKMKKLYEETGEYLNAVSGQQMVSHQELMTDVYCTKYENGAGVIVNYTNKPVSVNGYTVEGRGYKLWH